MSGARAPWGVVALVVGLGVMIALIVVMMRGGATNDAARSHTAGAPASPEVGAPPANVARDPRAAEAYVRRETCLAQCAADDRVCRATAVEVEQEARCAADARRCEAGCQ